MNIITTGQPLPDGVILALGIGRPYGSAYRNGLFNSTRTIFVFGGNKSADVYVPGDYVTGSMDNATDCYRVRLDLEGELPVVVEIEQVIVPDLKVGQWVLYPQVGWESLTPKPGKMAKVQVVRLLAGGQVCIRWQGREQTVPAHTVTPKN